MSVSIDQHQENSKIPRAELLRILVDRDGTRCQYPTHDHELDFSATGSQEVTIDHWICQSYGKANGWTANEIWDPSNLRLMCKKGNAAKGDLIPNEDGTLPAKPQSTFRFRRQKRAERPEICTSCNAGRNLGSDEWCNSCGCGANPGRFPKWRQMSVKECDHDLFYCVACTIWFPEYRRSVLDTLISGGDGYE